jgi:dTDP-4-dehydrorhamnose 3,5-epimerase
VSLDPAILARSPGRSETSGTALELAAFPDVLLLTPKRHYDPRGCFSETFSRRHLAGLGIEAEWVQDNYSLSHMAGVVRGLHLQRPPAAQAKLVRVNRGAIFDVIVEMRPDSPNFGRHAVVELNARDWTQLYIPVGYAHGFCTLEPDTEVIYKTSAYYSPADEIGILWNDPDLAIAWPVAGDAALLSAKDAVNARFAEISRIEWGC